MPVGLIISVVASTAVSVVPSAVMAKKEIDNMKKNTEETGKQQVNAMDTTLRVGTIESLERQVRHFWM